jgi:hypothetical protein
MVPSLHVLFTPAVGATRAGPPGAWSSNNPTYLGATGGVTAIATNETFQITGIMLLPGIEAPPASRSALIMRPIDQELLICKRYFYNGCPSLQGVTNGSTALSRLSGSHPVTMRIVPALTLVAALPIFEGAVATTIASLGTNYSTIYVLETEATTAAAMTAGRAPKTYQGSGGNLWVSARM